MLHPASHDRFLLVAVLLLGNLYILVNLFHFYRIIFSLLIIIIIIIIVFLMLCLCIHIEHFFGFVSSDIIVGLLHRRFDFCRICVVFRCC